MPQGQLIGYPLEFLATHREETSSVFQHLNVTSYKFLSPIWTRLRSPWDSNLDLVEAIPPRNEIRNILRNQLWEILDV